MIANTLGKFFAILDRFYFLISVSDRVRLLLLMFDARYVLTDLDKIDKTKLSLNQYVLNDPIGMHNAIKSIAPVDYPESALIA